MIIGVLQFCTSWFLLGWLWRLEALMHEHLFCAQEHTGLSCVLCLSFANIQGDTASGGVGSSTPSLVAGGSARLASKQTRRQRHIARSEQDKCQP